MLDANLVKELVDKCLDKLDNLSFKNTASSNQADGDIKAETKQTIAAVLQKAFSNLDLVTREQFDIQNKVLNNACQQVELLTKKITELENNK